MTRKKRPQRLAGARKGEGQAHRLALRQATFLLIILSVCWLGTLAQEPAQSVVGPSDLALENFNRVAASAAQIEEVLRKDPGLLVELKRWVAKEATERGQIIEDAALTDQGIFDRLARDLEFRSVATRLLQRYGYLLPKLNPESEAAKDEELLRQQRVRRLLKAAEVEDEEAARGKSSGKERTLDRAEYGEKAREERGLADQERRLRTRRGETIGPDADLPEAIPLDQRDGLSLSQRQRNPIEQPEFPSRRVVQTGLDLAALTGESASEALNPGLAETRAQLVGTGELTEAGNPSPSAPETRVNTRIPPSPTLGKEKEAETSESPEIVARANPYADIPSLYDMYQQVSPRPPELKRFGMNVFRYGTRDSDLLPMDLPVGPDYVVGPGDGLTVDLWGSISQRLHRTVDREGRLALPEVGPVLVSGRTLAEVQQGVQQILRTQFREVSADVSLSRLRTIRVYVVGDVDQPGAYDISSLSTPLNALFVAGGPTARGSLRVLRHFRGKQMVQEVDVYDLLLHGVRSDLKRLENGDTVLVPPIGAQATVEGALRRPAIYELHGEKTLAQILNLAGGVLPTATLRKIQVQRVEAHEKRTMLSLDIPEAGSLEAVNKQLESFVVRDGDEVRIFPIAPYNQDAVYVQGHVLRPGRYSYHSGMKLTDLVSSYADLLPEPAVKYAEIIRLNLPDYRPSVESFDLASALANPALAPALQPLDTVRIFGRYDFENPPTVWVGGEVRSPGVFRTSGQVHLRDAIHLAGGVTPDALLENAQVFRSLPDSKLKITSVNLAEALAGNPLDNILLQPRDRIVVHRNLAKVDPPSVFVKGEIAKPGRYPLTTNMRVGDLIRVAGGLKRSAYPETADLTRYLSQDSKQQVGEHHEVDIAAALAGDPAHNLPLQDGDALAIRQIPGWNDIGASVTVRGEVDHPGTYGIQPGERLSSVLKRAGGFLPTAYPDAAVLERVEIRELHEKTVHDLIERIQKEAESLKVSLAENPQEQEALKKASLEQRERVIERLRSAPVTGRLVIRLRRDLSRFENTADDIEMRTGDTLYVPKRPDFVVVTGQVYNTNAITYTPRKSAGWYLLQAGGVTELANKKAIFIVRANGSVVAGKGNGWWGGGVLSVPVHPGDSIVVPEKPIGGSQVWKNLISVAQIAQSAAVSAALIVR